MKRLNARPQALNKIDLPDADKNIDHICRKYDEVCAFQFAFIHLWLITLQSRIVLTSALAEIFLRKLHKQQFINYFEGTDRFELAEDQVRGDMGEPDFRLGAHDDQDIRMRRWRIS